MWAQPVCFKEAWAQNYHIPLYSPIPSFSSNNLTLLLTAIVLTPYFQYIICILYFGARLIAENVSPVTRARRKIAIWARQPGDWWLVTGPVQWPLTTPWPCGDCRGEVTPTPAEKQARDLCTLFWSAQFLELDTQRPLLCGTKAWSNICNTVMWSICVKTKKYAAFFLHPHVHVTISHSFDGVHWQTPDPRVDDSDTVCLWRHKLGMLRCASDWSEWC